MWGCNTEYYNSLHYNFNGLIVCRQLCFSPAPADGQFMDTRSDQRVNILLRGKG